MVALRTELFRGLFASTGVALLAASAAAGGGGNITTNVDEFGDLWLYGDDLGKHRRLQRRRRRVRG
jgi:hypothetical protein